jgi:hypothetical protein
MYIVHRYAAASQKWRGTGCEADPRAPTGDPSHNMPTTHAVTLLMDLQQGPLRGILQAVNLIIKDIYNLKYRF